MGANATTKTIALKRFEFCCSYTFDLNGEGIYGHNFILWVGVSGEVDEFTGMLINVAELKKIVSGVLDERYDHWKLDTSLQGVTIFSLSDLAVSLWKDIDTVMPNHVSLYMIVLTQQGGNSIHVIQHEQPHYVINGKLAIGNSGILHLIDSETEYLVDEFRAEIPFPYYSFPIELLETVKDLPCMVMLSGYWSKLYATALKDWHTTSFQAVTRAGKTATEWIWFNFPEPVALHDYQYLGDNFRERERIKRKKQRWVQRLEKMPMLERQALLAAIAESSDTDHHR